MPLHAAFGRHDNSVAAALGDSDCSGKSGPPAATLLRNAQAERVQ